MLIAIAAMAWLHLWLFPHLPDYRQRVASELSAKIGRPVVIGQMSGGWQNFQPYLRFQNVQLLDKFGQPAFTLGEGEGMLSWWPLLIGDLRFDALIANQPTLELTRDAEGVLRLAGLPLNQGSADNTLINWLLRQHEVGIRDGRLIWRDAMRNAPPLTLNHVNFSLQNLLFGHHRFRLDVTPQVDLAAPFTLNGDWRGDEVDDFSQWTGSAQAKFGALDLARAGQWLPYPISVLSGKGELNCQLSFRGLELTQAQADLSIRQASLRLAHDLDTLDVDDLAGHLVWADKQGDRTLQLSKLKLTADGGKLLDGGVASLALHKNGGGELSLADFTLPALANLPPSLPLPTSIRKALSGMKPSGRIDTFAARWEGNWREPSSYKGSTRFSGLGLTAPAPWPTVGLIDGTIEVTEQGGKFNLNSPQFDLNAKDLFEKPLQFKQLALDGSWQRQGKGWVVKVDHLAGENADLAAKASATWHWTGVGSGNLDLAANLARGNAARVVDYLPLTIGPETRVWLKDSLLGGETRDAAFVLKGPLDDFPFHDGKTGVWSVTTQLRGITLDYAPGWPRAEKMDGELRLRGNRMEIDASGNIMAAKVQRIHALIEDLAHSDHVTIEGDVAASSAEFFRFINKSPLEKNLGSFTHEARAEGDGSLALKLHVPFDSNLDTHVDGSYHIKQNRLTLGPSVPVIDDLNGELHFTERGVDAKGLRGRILGGDTSADLKTRDDGTVQISATGQADMQQVAQRYTIPLGDSLSGRSDYRVELALPKQGGWQLALDAPLAEARIDLPAPLHKEAGNARQLRLGIEADARSERWRMALAGIGSAELRRVPNANNEWRIERGDIRMGAETPNPNKPGLWLNLNVAEIDFDAWQARLAGGNGDGNGPFAGVEGKVGQLIFSGHKLDNVSAKLIPSNGVWRIDLTSQQAEGSLTWAPQGRGRATGHLSRLSMPLPTASGVGDKANTQQLPAVEAIVDNFEFRQHPLGKLDIKAQPQRDSWQIERLNLSNPDGQFAMQGLWRNSGKEALTAVKLDVETPNLGKLLGRLGYPEAMRRGSTKLNGELSWQGSPLSPDFPSLAGKLQLKTESGQFAKIDPGVGRLLGILSLQALPRRITLDFRDIFSEGFAFDSIEGESQIRQGILHTDNLHISGPAAQILFRGDANTLSETQNLRVRIVPTIGDGVAVGAGLALANPVLGVGAFLLQRVFKDPLGQLVAYEYDITGSWDDPKIERVGGGEAASKKGDAGVR